MKAIWKGQVLAESTQTVNVEGNAYFPSESIDSQFFEKSKHQTTCPWKGVASYYTLSVNGEKNENAAWFYPDTKHAAEKIKNYVAFWKGVEVIDS